MIAAPPAAYRSNEFTLKGSPVNTRKILGSIFAATSIVVVGWQVGTIHIGSVASVSSVGTGRTFDGTSIATRYGNVQVRITVAGSKITEVTALQLTDKDGRSAEISAQAAPLLRSEVLASQSAKVATISGATYTSDGYLSSLQSAIDKAGI